MKPLQTIARSVAGAVLLAFTTTGLSGCNAATSRIELDALVGHHVGEAWEVHVDDGLAVVREVTGSSLALWASAPNVSLSLKPPRGRSRISILNLVPQTQVNLETRDGSQIECGPSTDTSLICSLNYQGDRSLRLTLRAPRRASDAVRLAFLSDIQTGIGSVKQIYQAINAQGDLDFVLGAGDWAQAGTDQELAVFEQAMSALRIPYYSTLGNHDIAEPGAWQARFGRGNLHFEFGDVHFSLLDSADAAIAPEAFSLLDGWLREGEGRRHIFATHIPPLDPTGTRNGAFASRNHAGKLLAALSAGGVDLTLYGHVHSFRQFTNADIPAFISGGGGATDEKFDGYGRHFLRIVVPERQDAPLDVTMVEVED